MEQRGTFVAIELNSSPEKSTRKGPKSFVVSAVQFWGSLGKEDKQSSETPCCFLCLPASFSCRNRPTSYLGKSHFPDQENRHVMQGSTFRTPGHPWEFCWNYWRSPLPPGISGSKENTGSCSHYQVERIEATPRNTELRAGRSIFLTTSLEPLDPVRPEVYPWSFPLHSVSELNKLPLLF